MSVVTALDAQGAAAIDEGGPGLCQRHFRPCFIMLDHFLRTGTMLPGAQALARAEAA